MSARWRLFVAVELPADARAAIVRAVDALPPIGGLRFTPGEELHLTLLFLGAVDPGDVDAIGSRLEGVAAFFAPFPTSLLGFGRFPERSRARVLWVGLRDDESHLGDLARATKGALADLVSTEDRPFRAHVTVGRARDPVPVPRQVLAAAIEPVRFDVASFALFRSHPGAGAGRYEAVQRWHLGPPSP